MRQPLSFVSQGLMAALILAVGAVVWIAREPVSAAVSGLFVSAEKKGGKSKGRRGRRNRAVPVVVQAVEQGAIPFTCQGSENGMVIEGGKTLAWEMISELLSQTRSLDRLFL